MEGIAGLNDIYIFNSKNLFIVVKVFHPFRMFCRAKLKDIFIVKFNNLFIVVPV